MSKFFKHLHTINTHRRLVRRTCFKIGIPWQGLTHDLSKYSFDEFIPSVKFFTDGKYSPTENERMTNGYSLCWMHHKGRNKHHIEYWYDINPETRKYEPVKMPVKYLKEMFADRIAASKVYKKQDYNDSCPLEYLTSHEGSKMLHKESYEELKRWLEVLASQGERVAFKMVKKVKNY